MPKQEVSHKDHRKRMKSRFLLEGLDSFESHNILELMLFYAIPQGDTNPVAHRLLEEFGSFSGVLNASVENLCQVKGVGEHAATLIKLFAAVSRRYLDDGNSGGVLLNSTEEAGRFIVPKFVGRTVETAYLVCLDSKRKVIYCGVLGEGSVNSVPIFVRSIVEKAIAVNASYVILAHNHPTGFALPSGDDIRTTQAVSAALAPLSITLLDHLVVAMEDYISMQDSGIMDGCAGLVGGKL